MPSENQKWNAKVGLVSLHIIILIASGEKKKEKRTNKQPNEKGCADFPSKNQDHKI